MNLAKINEVVKASPGDSNPEQDFTFTAAGVECTAGERIQRTPKPRNPSCEYG